MQTNNRLGCLTGTGLIAAFITVIVLAGFTFVSGGHMFSSGDLNAQAGEIVGGVASHAQITECKACHSAPWERDTMADRCLACHTHIAEQMMNVAQLHGAISQKDPALVCRDCHFEHRGATASLTDMGENVFPHEELGYSLKGHQLTAKNEAFVCSDCHGEDVSTFASDSCQTCHAQIDIVFAQAHLLSFGRECLACHNGVDRYGDDFNHDLYVFQLTGGHATANCTGCHLDARSNVDLQSAPQDCYSCHYQVDQHLGQFGKQCEACHTPENWDAVSFDHNLSNFPLTGAHVTVNCEDCHLNDTFVGTQSSCVSCHAEPVEHLGQFGVDCAACHTTTAWIPATFTGDHTFPLNHGEQGTVSCATCHPDTYTTYTCYGCHEHTEANIVGEHREEGISDFQNCVECHADGREHDD